jgi:vacuolar-type H+-ATPase subunit H
VPPKASSQAEQTRRDADQHARQLVSNAKKNADQILSQAKQQADQLLAETKSEAERQRTSAQRHVDDLNKQKESVAAHLAQISQLLGTQMPGLSDALKPAPAVPAVASSPARAVTAAPAPAGGAQRHAGARGRARPARPSRRRATSRPRLPTLTARDWVDRVTA